MKPIEFKEHNVVYAKDQPEYQPLPAYKSNTPQGEVVCCWQLSFKERIKLLISGKLWIAMLTFNKPLTAIFPTVNKTDVLPIEN